MSDCCQTTEDGNALCTPMGALPANGQTSACASEKAETSAPLPIPYQNQSAAPQPAPPGLWEKVRSGIMFGVACLASPCCTPLIVPLVIALLAGTPLAAWLTAHLGWVYGGLTLLSVVSLGLGIHWMRQRPASRRKTFVSRPVSKLSRTNVVLEGGE